MATALIRTSHPVSSAKLTAGASLGPRDERGVRRESTHAAPPAAGRDRRPVGRTGRRDPGDADHGAGGDPQALVDGARLGVGRQPDHAVRQLVDDDRQGDLAGRGGDDQVVALGDADLGRGGRGQPGDRTGGGAGQVGLAVLQPTVVEQQPPGGEHGLVGPRLLGGSPRRLVRRGHAGRRPRDRARPARPARRPGRAARGTRPSRRPAGRAPGSRCSRWTAARRRTAAAGPPSPRRCRPSPPRRRPAARRRRARSPRSRGSRGRPRSRRRRAPPARPPGRAGRPGRRHRRAGRRAHRTRAAATISLGAATGRRRAGSSTPQAVCDVDPGGGVRDRTAAGQQVGQRAGLERTALAGPARDPGQPGTGRLGQRAARRDRSPGHGGQPLADEDDRAAGRELVRDVLDLGVAARDGREHLGLRCPGAAGTSRPDELGQPAGRAAARRTITLVPCLRTRLAQPQEDDRRLLLGLEARRAGRSARPRGRRRSRRRCRDRSPRPRRRGTSASSAECGRARKSMSLVPNATRANLRVGVGVLDGRPGHRRARRRRRCPWPRPARAPRPRAPRARRRRAARRSPRRGPSGGSAGRPRAE